MQFAASNRYYAQDVEAYKNIITTVKNRIEEEKKGYDAQMKKENEEKKRKQDSTKAARQKRRDSIGKLETKPLKGKPTNIPKKKKPKS